MGSFSEWSFSQIFEKLTFIGLTSFSSGGQKVKIRIDCVVENCINCQLSRFFEICTSRWSYDIKRSKNGTNMYATRNCVQFSLLILSKFNSIIYFYSLWNYQKTIRCFRRNKSCLIGLNPFNISSNIWQESLNVSA